MFERIKRFNKKGRLGLFEMADRFNPLYRCDSCGKKFGFFYYSVRLASYWQDIDGSFVFRVRCRKCGHNNYRERVK